MLTSEQEQQLAGLMRVLDNWGLPLPWRPFDLLFQSHYREEETTRALSPNYELSVLSDFPVRGVTRIALRHVFEGILPYGVAKFYLGTPHGEILQHQWMPPLWDGHYVN